MKCKLTYEGRDVIEGFVVITTVLFIIFAVVFILGWVQLHIFGVNMIPDIVVGSPFEYYMITGGTILGVAFLTTMLLIAAYLRIATSEGLPKLFTCKGEEV